MPSAPTLTDGVVTLRAHRPADVRRVLEQCRDPLSQAWTTVPAPYTEADATFFVERVVPAGWADGTDWAFAVERDGLFAGTVSLRDRGDRRAEIAFGAHPDARGTGAMERALRLLLAWGVDERDLAMVIWWANRGNWASRRLAWRLGFSFDGTVRDWLPQRGERYDGWVGTLLRDEPRSPRTTWLADPVLDGDGVRLRPFSAADAPRIVEGIGDAATQHWLTFFPRDPGPADALDYLERVQERLATGHTITWGFCAPDDDRLLGAVGLHRLQEEPEIGFWAHPDARGRGLTTRAAAVAVDHAFGELGLTRLAAYASVPNVASRTVLERLGMRPTGVRRQAVTTGDGAVVDLAGYDLLASEWVSPRPSGGR